jgi:predicted transposase/invertase (TIGR01784 family)
MRIDQKSVLDYSSLRYALDYSKEEGRKEGIEKGIEEGREEEQRRMLKRFYKRGKSVKDITEEMDLTEELICFLLDSSQ